ncbi:hypothetical protein A0J61_09748 [Choanephora cucurbitarum]|uniref:Uncharacterized protein n=1 Tax=Choanephora cucurbitarum TaxID=101091 RepID=A0A1C7N0K8_9FUNG|nr:hypothetical protein A0J61_09748 [Choanephora cucurbitarum]
MSSFSDAEPVVSDDVDTDAETFEEEQQSVVFKKSHYEKEEEVETVMQLHKGELRKARKEEVVDGKSNDSKR